MKITRSSKTSLKCATKKKKQILATIFQEYTRVVNKFIDYFWDHPEIVSKAQLTASMYNTTTIKLQGISQTLDNIMWIVKSITFIEYHPYVFLTFVLIFIWVVWFFWKEYRRPSYKEQSDVERLLKGLKEERNNE